MSNYLFHPLPFRLCAVGYNKQQFSAQLMTPQYYEVLIGSFGKGVIRIQGEEPFVLHPEQAVIIKPGSGLELQEVIGGWEMAVLRFDCSPSLVTQFGFRLNKPFALRSTKRTVMLIEQLWSQGEEEETYYLCSEIIFSLLLELKMQSVTLHQQQQYTVKMTQDVLEYIHENYAGRLTLEEISRRFGYSTHHLNRLFKKELGHTVHQYMLKLQLEQAANMLSQEEMTIEQVADKVGMEWRSFYRLFQRMYNVSPGEFRKKLQRKY